MPRGVSRKREHEYEKLEREFKRNGRYRGREKEVAARIVNQQRARAGETKEAKRKQQTGHSPDRGLPIDGYQHLTVPQVQRRLDRLSAGELREVKKYEQQHKHRKTLLHKLDIELAHGAS